MEKVELKKVLAGLAVASIIGLAVCNGRAAKNQQSSASSRGMTVENVNEAAGSFDMVDVSTECMSVTGAGYAAEQGNPVAVILPRLLYENGFLVENREETKKWYRKAPGKNHPDALPANRAKADMSFHTARAPLSGNSPAIRNR